MKMDKTMNIAEMLDEDKITHESLKSLLVNALNRFFNMVSRCL